MIVPVRCVSRSVAATVKPTVPLPAPLAPELMEIQGTLLTAAQGQLPEAVTFTIPLLPPAPKFCALWVKAEGVKGEGNWIRLDHAAARVGSDDVVATHGRSSCVIDRVAPVNRSGDVGAVFPPLEVRRLMASGDAAVGRRRT